MNRIDIYSYKKYADLPLDEFKVAKGLSIYALDFNWNYLFVNDFVYHNLGIPSQSLIGKNMWAEFPELKNYSPFITLKDNTEKGLSTNISITSPVTGQKLNIIGKPLTDCYFFYSLILPDKEQLLQELRSELKKK